MPSKRIKDIWIDLIYQVVTGSRRIRLLLTPVVGLSYVLFSCLFVLAAFFTDQILAISHPLPSQWSLIIGLPLLGIGLVFMGWSVFHFLKVKGTPVPFNPPPKLVNTGPYRLTRNPMVGGIFLLLFGIGFTWRSLSLVIVFTPLFILINVVELKLIEEPELEKRLGPVYKEYKNSTPMFFPFVKTANEIEKGSFDDG